MAKINISYDTIDKTASITIDGKSIENVDSVNIYCCGYPMSESEDNEMEDEDEPKKFYFSLTTCEHDEDNKMMMSNRISASLKKPQSTVTEQIHDRYFSSAY